MNKGVPLTILVCCVWPVLFHLVVAYGVPAIMRRDWRNIRWDEIKFPWSKQQ